jgi:hypothetical protein
MIGDFSHVVNRRLSDRVFRREIPAIPEVGSASVVSVERQAIDVFQKKGLYQRKIFPSTPERHFHVQARENHITHDIREISAQGSGVGVSKQLPHVDGDKIGGGYGHGTGVIQSGSSHRFVDEDLRILTIFPPGKSRSYFGSVNIS